MSFAGMLDESEADELLEIIQKNKGYDDLESRKLYRILPDEKAK